MKAFYYLGKLVGRIYRAITGGWIDGKHGLGLSNLPKEGE